MQPQLEVQQVLQAHWHTIFKSALFSPHQKRMLSALRQCRTAALGGHLDACTSCGVVQVSYNSCRNRHCPKCQGKAREEWIAQRTTELLPVPYFHVVFTLPACLNPYAEKHPRQVYHCLFRAAWQTLLTFGRDPKHLGATPAATMVLHTWGQNLMLHPHVHCIVPGGGINAKGEWVWAKNKGKFLFPVRAMSKVFRATFVRLLRKSTLSVPASVYQQCFRKKWVIYAKRPFFGPKQVIEYLGRYTHKIAISNHRIQHLDEQRVTFYYKDYRHGGAKRKMTLTPLEFVRRFALHILPSRFVRIRHFGWLASRNKTQNLLSLRSFFGIQPLTPVKEQQPLIHPEQLPYTCPHCGGHMIVIEHLPPSRAPPSPPGITTRVKQKV